MSNVIKSFRVVEKESVEEVVKQVENTDNVDNIIKSVLLNEAKTEADVIIKIAEERSRQILSEIEEQRVIIINSAQEQSHDIIEEARKLGYDEGYEKGYNKGFQKGYDEGKLVSDDLITESLNIKEKYITTRNKLLKELENDIIQLVINIYEKILDKEIEEGDDTITSLVLNGIKNLDPTDKLTIIVSKEDYPKLEESKDQILANASLINELDMKYDINLSKGDCILETAKGSIDISIRDQLEEVKELLNTILNNE